MKKLKWTTVQRRVGDLKIWAQNPRFITKRGKQKLHESLEQFDLVEIPVIDTDDTVIAGNQKVTLLMEAGRADEVIDVRIPNRPLTEAERKRYGLMSNIHQGEWDYQVLESEFADVDLEEVGVPEFPEPESKYKKTIELRPFKKAHVLLTFSLEMAGEVEKALAFLPEGIEINKSAN